MGNLNNKIISLIWLVNTDASIPIHSFSGTQRKIIKFEHVLLGHKVNLNKVDTIFSLQTLKLN